MGGSGVVFSLLVQVLQPMVDGNVVPFDRADSMVATVKLIAAEFVQVLQVALGLLVLVYQLP
jgi:hypothetical protein